VSETANVAFSYLVNKRMYILTQSGKVMLAKLCSLFPISRQENDCHATILAHRKQTTMMMMMMMKQLQMHYPD